MNNSLLPNFHGPDLESALRLASVIAAALLFYAVWRSTQIESHVKKACFCASVVGFFVANCLDLLLAAQGINVSALHHGLFHGAAVDQNMLLAGIIAVGLCSI